VNLRSKKLKIAAVITAVLLMTVLYVVCIFELRMKPMVAEGAKSRATAAATEMINNAIAKVITNMQSPVTVSRGEDGMYGVEVNTALLSIMKTEATSELTKAMSDAKIMNFRLPLGNITGSTLLAGRGRTVSVRLVPIGDVETDIRTEFLSVGINQTLHKIFMRVKVSFNMFVAGDIHKLELENNVTLAETVIIGKVPDAYTAINRWEIDEQEENDLNDYAATLP